MNKVRQIKAFFLLAVILVMMGHNVLPHHHTLQDEGHATDFVHSHHHDHHHGELHSHHHHGDPVKTTDSDAPEKGRFLDFFLKGHLNSTHSHLYTTANFNPVRRDKLTYQSDIIVIAGFDEIIDKGVVRCSCSPHIPPLIQNAVKSSVSLRAPPDIV